ncbi:uncharacterized protein BDV17DRAFT_285116 [Aspergillus undulatus]|uniref:uncharacterized protein n=1 Tax=Aspergillus undulatus TaxID=1810928 RepID=UPI003CCD8EF9
MYDLVITNGICVTASDEAPLDITIQGERIALTAPSGSLSTQGIRVIDAAGGYVNGKPGGIDCHVYLQEPSMFGKGTSADNYESGSRSAIAGGITTIITFAPLQKVTDSTPLSIIHSTLSLATGQCYCYCDFSFHVLGTASLKALSEFPRLREEGISSNRILAMIHAENGEVLDWLTNQLEDAKLFAPKATNRAIALSSLIRGTPILLVHKPGFEGTKCVCSPPPRGKSDQDAIWTGLANGTGKKTCITEKRPVGQFKHIPNGIPGVETRMPLALSGDRLALTKFVQVTSTSAAKLYGLYPRKGALIPGVSDADVTIWYPESSNMDLTVTNEMLHHDCDYTPYEGRKIYNWPRYTIIRGKVVWDRDNGGIVGDKGYGQFIKRDAAVGIWKTTEQEFDLESL